MNPNTLVVDRGQINRILLASRLVYSSKNPASFTHDS